MLSGAAPSVCSSVALAASPASPQTVGTPVTWTATASGCSSLQYKYFRLPPSGTWEQVRDWGAATYAWDTTALAAGTWQFQVWARQSGSTVGRAGWRGGG